jgi:hypothetical protein
MRRAASKPMGGERSPLDFLVRVLPPADAIHVEAMVIVTAIVVYDRRPESLPGENMLVRVGEESDNAHSGRANSARGG